MEIKLPESSIIKSPHKMEGPMKEAKKSFYDLARDKVKYLTQDEVLEWNKKISGRKNCLTSASAIISHYTKVAGEGDIEKWIDGLEIIVNKDGFNFNDKDYSDLIPFILEHELYETWLNAKKGATSSLDIGKRHLLARRREFLLAEQKGLGDKLFEYLVSIKPSNEEECKYALQSARKKLKSTE